MVGNPGDSAVGVVSLGRAYHPFQIVPFLLAIFAFTPPLYGGSCFPRCAPRAVLVSGRRGVVCGRP